MTLRLIFPFLEERERHGSDQKTDISLIKPGRLLEGYMYTGEINKKNNALGT